MTKNKSGFTLIELLVVLSIIMLVLSFALVSYRDSKARGRDASREEAMKQIQNSLYIYVTNKQIYPNCAVGVIRVNGSDCMTTALMGAGLLNTPIVDPLGGDTGNGSGCPPATGDYIYCYEALSGGHGYRLQYALETSTILNKSAGLQVVTTSP